MTTISSSIDETIAQLDALNERTTARKRADFAALGAIVGNLSTPWDPDIEDVVIDSRPRPDRPTRRESPPDQDEPHLPPTRDGHAWGPAVRAKLTAEARSGGSW